MGKLLKSRPFVAATIAIVLVALYGAAGFYLAPGLIRGKAIEFVKANYGRDLAIGEVRVNPFKLQLEIKDVALPDADRQAMLGFKRLFIDFEVSSLWHRAYTFKNIALESPVIRAVIRPDSSVNFADLAPQEATPPQKPEPEEASLPSVWIHSFVVSDGLADYVDQARRTVFERRFTPITFMLEDFRTTPQGGDFGLEARNAQHEVFAWKGRFALAPGISSEGDFRILDLRAPGVAEFLGDALPFGLTDGLIRLAGHYRLALGTTNDIAVDLPKIELSGLALRAQGAETDWVKIPELVLSDTHVALPQQSVTIANITLSSLAAQVWKAQDGSINVTQLFSPAPATGPSEQAPAGATPPTVAPIEVTGPDGVPPPAKPWSVQVGAVDVKGAAIDFEDRSISPAVKFALSPLNLGVKDVSLDLARPLPIQFDTKINGKGTLTGTGHLTPDPLAADIDLDLAGFDLRDVQPYAAASTALTIQDGTLGMKGRLSMTPPSDPEADITFAGDVSVASFKSIDNTLQQDFFNFERLEIAKMRYAMGPDAISIDRIRVVKPFNRVIMSADQVLNVSAVFDPQGTAAALAARRAAETAKAAEPARKKSRAELRAEKKAAEAAAKARAAAPPPPAPDLKETGMPIRIRELRVEGGRMDFADLSIKPSFAADITGLNGTVTGMSSDPKARAKVDFKGRVGEFSPVTIAGELQPFAYERYTDIGMKFENVSLPIFNPYSGKFAGYSIAKGKLTTDLQYTVEDRKLDAKHHIRIDQLEWGPATAEKTEATLPVKFATSLLKDADGVISLDVPVTGTLDDPKFRIGPIVWQIIRNILTKVITSPFRALGALFKDAEESQFVDFAPGAATLDPATAERLGGLAKALAAKSDIRLNVPIGTLPELDQVALVDQRYAAARDAAVRRLVYGKNATDDKPLPAFDTLDSDKRIEVLLAMVQQLSGAVPQVPPPPTPPEGTPRKEARALVDAAALDYLEKDARSRLAPNATELEALGQQRAEAVQRALLADTGLAPERVFLIKNGKVAAQDGKVRLELAME